MSQINWLEVLGWDLKTLEDIRLSGYSYLRQGHYHLAITFFETLVILSSGNAYDLQTLGALYLEVGKTSEALNYLEKSFKVNPDHAPTLLNRAKALFALGYKTQAIKQAKALTSNPEEKIAAQASALVQAYS